MQAPTVRPVWWAVLRCVRVRRARCVMLILYLDACTLSCQHCSNPISPAFVSFGRCTHRTRCVVLMLRLCVPSRPQIRELFVKTAVEIVSQPSEFHTVSCDVLALWWSSVYPI